MSKQQSPNDQSPNNSPDQADGQSQQQSDASQTPGFPPATDVSQLIDLDNLKKQLDEYASKQREDLKKEREALKKERDQYTADLESKLAELKELQQQQETERAAKELELAQSTTAKTRQVDEQPVFLKKDTARKFPINPGHLTGYIVRQTKTVTIDGVKEQRPAHGINEIGIYTPDEFARFSEEGGLFKQHGLNIEVWHKPGQTNSIAKPDNND